MTVATVAQIRAGLADALRLAYDGGWNVSAYVLANTFAPLIDVLPQSVSYDLAFRGGADELSFVVRAVIPANFDEAMQRQLDLLVDPRSSSSLKRAVETDKTLGGAVSWCRVTSCSGYKLYETPGQPPVLGVEFHVQVMT